MPERLREALALIQDTSEDPLRRPELAAALGLSQRQLERMFRRHTGVCVVRYSCNARLDRARWLLTQTELSILEVALASGFASPQTCSHAYHQRFGLTPRDDRVQGRAPFQFRAWPLHAGSSLAKGGVS